MDENMFLSNPIAGFFDDQYLWKEKDTVLDLLFRNSYQGKIATKTTTVGLGVASRTQPLPDSPGLVKSTTFLKKIDETAWFFACWCTFMKIKS